MALPYFHAETFPMLVCTVCLVGCEWSGLQHLMEYIFWISLGTNIVIILNFLSRVIGQITSYLGIYCFSLQKRPPHKTQ